MIFMRLGRTLGVWVVCYEAGSRSGFAWKSRPREASSPINLANAVPQSNRIAAGGCGGKAARALGEFQMVHP